MGGTGCPVVSSFALVVPYPCFGGYGLSWSNPWPGGVVGQVWVLLVRDALAWARRRLISSLVALARVLMYSARPVELVSRMTLRWGSRISSMPSAMPEPGGGLKRMPWIWRRRM